MGFSIVCNGCRALGPPVLCPGVTSSFAGSSSLLIAVRIWFQKRAGGKPQAPGGIAVFSIKPTFSQERWSQEWGGLVQVFVFVNFPYWQHLLTSLLIRHYADGKWLWSCMNPSSHSRCPGFINKVLLKCSNANGKWLWVRGHEGV